MASQLANITSNFGQQVAALSGSGLKQGAQNFVNARKQAKEERVLDQQAQSNFIDLFDKKYGGAIASTKTPEEWAKNKDFLPKGMPYEAREPYLMNYTARQAEASESGMDNVQSSEFLPGGGVRLTYKSGKTEIRRPTEEDEAFIQGREKYGARLQGLRSGERKAADIAQDISKEAFQTVGNLRANNNRLMEVVDLVGDGANTGPLVSRLPTIRASSARLDQIRNELGLDVIGSVTFGALSEGELQLALDTALPTKLEGPELVSWAQDKIAAQNKLIDYLESQAEFLSVPGNKVSDWISQRKEIEQLKAEREAAKENIGRFQIEVLD